MTFETDHTGITIAAFDTSLEFLQRVLPTR